MVVGARPRTGSSRELHGTLASIPNPPCDTCRKRLLCQFGNLACYNFAGYVMSTGPEIWAWRGDKNDPHDPIKAIPVRKIYDYIYSGNT